MKKYTLEDIRAILETGKFDSLIEAQEGEDFEC